MSLMFAQKQFAPAMSQDSIALACPAALSAGASPNTSGRYNFISTGTAIEILKDSGWHVTSAKQTKSRNAESAPYTNHLVSFAPADPIGDDSDLQPNLVLYNSHNAKSSLQLMAGLIRFTCDNSLVAGEGFKAKLSHRHLNESSFQGMLTDIIASLPDMLQKIERMKETKLDAGQCLDFAYNAASLRWGIHDSDKREIMSEKDSGLYAVNDSESYGQSTLQDLLSVRRRGDVGTDTFTIFNRIQESIMTGGSKYQAPVRVLSYNKDKDLSKWRKAKPLSQIKTVIDTNRKLWDLADQFALEAA